MKMLRNAIICAAVVLLNLFAAGLSFASPPLPEQLTLTPGFYLRPPGSVGFRLFEDGQTIESGSILTVKSSFNLPLATETKILCGSHTISFFPGATVKILADGLQPLSGRIEIISEAALEPLAIRTGKFAGEISEGHLLLEVTPDNGTYVAMRSSGVAWFKDQSRKIFELENGRELHFPLFGPAVEMPVLSGFWSDNPSSFSAAGKKVADRAAKKTLDAAEADGSDEDSAAVASDSEALDVSPISEKSLPPESESASDTVSADNSTMQAD